MIMKGVARNLATDTISIQLRANLHVVAISSTIQTNNIFGESRTNLDVVVELRAPHAWVRSKHRFSFQNLLPNNHGVNVVESFLWSKVITWSCSTHVMKAAFIQRVSPWSILVTIDHILGTVQPR
jgi:hypothetical protein